MKLKTALRLGRVSNLPTVWSNVLAGVALAGATPSPLRFVWLALAMTSFYVGGMYLNDAFDREYDARVRPERPIPSGEISARSVFAAGFAMLLAGTAAIALLPGAAAPYRALGCALALAATIVFYDVNHKQNPLSPLIMGLCRVLVYVTAAFCVSPAPDRTLWVGAAALLCYLFGLTYAAKQENLGRIDNLWPLVLLAVPVMVGVWFGRGHWLAAGLLAASTAYALRFLMRPQARNIPAAIGHFIASISLLDASMIDTGSQPLAVAACCAAFVLTLVFQRFVAGT